jgi:phospholipase C
MNESMDRRNFLRKSAVFGGAAAAASALPLRFGTAEAHNRLGFGGTSILDVGAQDAPIDTVVVLMMENRSFDHYLGWLARDQHYFESGRRRYGSGFRVNGDTSQSYRDPDGEVHDTYYLPAQAGEANPYRGCHHPDPGHGWDDGRAQRDRGFLGEGSGNDDFALGYYLSDDIPFYADLARRFTSFDRYHCSLLGPTFPNREYLHAAQSGGVKDNSLPVSSTRRSGIASAMRRSPPATTSLIYRWSRCGGRVSSRARATSRTTSPIVRRGRFRTSPS